MRTSWMLILKGRILLRRILVHRTLVRQSLIRTRALFTPDVLLGLRNGSIIAAALLVLALPPAVPRRGASTSQIASISNSNSAELVGAAIAESTGPRRAVFGDQSPSPQARWVADWVADSRDNRGLPFAILDKHAARVFVFDRAANLVGSSLVLLGSATGDESVAGIGDRPLSQIRAEERTTPAGRFLSEPGHDDTGEDVVWVDYDSAVAMHRVKVVDPKERRFERIATPTAADKRISNGCINVPIAFFDNVIKPALGRSHAVIYVLPELKPLQEVFRGSYDVDSRDAGSSEPPRVDRTMVMYRPAAGTR